MILHFNIEEKHLRKISDITPKFKMGGVAPDGTVLKVNRRYITINGKPVLPVMGEFHYTRAPEKYWREILTKMKACGINIISTYVFWNHHEIAPGKFDWSGRRSLGNFVKLCGNLGFYVWLRIGPFCHGEVRNGGIPDWWWDRPEKRTLHPEWLVDVERLYTEIAHQVDGLLFKDGGPIIGIQLENEYQKGESGIPYISELKKIAVRKGLIVPIYSVTGWGENATVPPGEVLPLYGAYPDAPWSLSLKRFTPAEYSAAYFFNDIRNGGDMGAVYSDIDNGDNDKNDINLNDYPDFTCELGGGNQITYHRRPVISADDVAAIIYTRLGSGANLLGYYMFYGGTNPRGRGNIKYLQETAGRPALNEYPVFSYDFYAPISEFGRLRPSYFKLKTLHHFINTFGGTLAPMISILPKELPIGPDDYTTPRAAFRTDGKSGFLFINNYDRFNDKMKDIRDVAFEINFTDRTIKIPDEPITIPVGTYFILPVLMDLGGITIRYSTVMPIACFEVKVGVKISKKVYIFGIIKGIPPLIAFEGNPAIEILDKPGKIFGDYEPTGQSDKFADSKEIVLNRNERFITLKSVKSNRSIALNVKNSGSEIMIIITDMTEIEKIWMLNFRRNKGYALSDAWLSVDNERIFTEKEYVPEWIFGGLFTADGSSGMYYRGSFNFPETVNNSEHEKEGGCIPPRVINSVSSKEKIEIGTEISAVFTEIPDKEADNFIERPPPTPEGMLDVTGKLWRIKISGISGELPKKLHKIYLKIDFVGDIFRLYINGKFVWDTFYTGEPLFIDPVRLGFQIGETSDLIVEITPIERDADIYLEKPPQFPKGVDSLAEPISVDVIPVYGMEINPRLYRRNCRKTEG